MGRKTHGIVFVSKSREGREQLASRINRLRPLKKALRLLLYSISRDAKFSKFETTQALAKRSPNWRTNDMSSARSAGAVRASKACSSSCWSWASGLACVSSRPTPTCKTALSSSKRLRDGSDVPRSKREMVSGSTFNCSASWCWVKFKARRCAAICWPSSLPRSSSWFLFVGICAVKNNTDCWHSPYFVEGRKMITLDK